MSRREQAEGLLAELLSDGAIPVMVDGRLQIDAPLGVLTPARQEQLAACIAEMRTIVATRWRPREKCVSRRPCRTMSICAEPVDGRPCLIPPTCCLCGGPLAAGRLYLCDACSHTGAV